MKFIGVLTSALVIFSFFVGCSGESINVKISDMLTKTKITVNSGKTVSEILKEAEIEIGDKDKVNPSADTVIDKDTKITVLRYVTCTVACDGTTKKVSLVGGKVSDAIEKAEFKITDNDSVNYDLDSCVTEDMKIVVERSKSVILKVDGKTKKYHTSAKTVDEFLNENNIKVRKSDFISNKGSEKIKSNIKIVIKRVTTKTITKRETIKYSTKYEKSDSINVGTSKVTVSGVNGQKKVTYKVTYVDGKEKSRKVIKEKIVKNPVDEVVTQGTKQTSQQSQNNSVGANGKKIISKTKVDDCDGSGHGYYIIKYSDGTEDYEEY